MNKFFKESALWVLIVLPYIYLATIWGKLPERVPTHFDIQGNPNDWSSRTSLLFIPAALGIFMYILLLIIPHIDPKKKIQEMGEKYFSFRFILTSFFSLFSIYLLYTTCAGNLKNPNLLFALIGVLLSILGNYFQTVRPNYFIGIRTPWTLESENVWKKTHRFGGKLWMAGGVLIAILAFFNIHNLPFFIIFFSVVILLSIIPIVYSYILFKKEKN